METRLDFEILRQPDDTTCGPTCLHAIYSYFGETIPLSDLVDSIYRLHHGGTLAVFLGCDALRRGYRARLYTYNLRVFDPTWFDGTNVDLPAKLRAQLEYKKSRRLHQATRGYIEFLKLGGEICFEDLRPGLIRRYLKRNIPILAGLSSTYLYRTMREYGPEDDEDDLRGEPAGHFVVLCGYDKESRAVEVADPLHPNPSFSTNRYSVTTERVINAVLLGVLTYDANMLVIEPATKKQKGKV
ncbi:MAG: hypothetical protein JJU11_13960 [Candidatus Sumerlaeia bacterium]|nr:hypothetical protein [Candidatus Sumerlaeia bacterium]